MTNKSILMILPVKDFNEEEFLTVKNTFEKKELKIFIASNSSGLCTGKSGLKVKADITFIISMNPILPPLFLSADRE